MTSILPPHNLEAEQAVLGAVLLVPSCLRRLILEQALRSDHFYRDRHRVIWSAMTAMSDAEQHVDVATLAAHLKAAGQLDDAGGRAGLDELTGAVPSLGGLRRYAEIIVENWRWRQRLNSTYAQQAAIATPDEAAYEVALHAAHELVALTTQEGFVDPEALAVHVHRFLDEKPQPGLPVPVELSSLGRMVRFRPGHVTVIAGWSHHGKSIVAGQFAAAMGARGHRSVIWSNEDTETEIVARHLNRMTGVPAALIADRNLNHEQLTKAIRELGRLPFGVQPCFGWDARQVGRHVRQVRPDVAILDHFHALPGVTRTDGIDEAMQALVAAAGQTPCHLFVVCQLNQERLKQVVRPAPVARDLRGSGQIYNLAHTVLLIYRQEEELEDSNGRLLGRPVQLEDGHVDVAKNKPTGQLGSVAVRFDARRLQFVEAAL